MSGKASVSVEAAVKNEPVADDRGRWPEFYSAIWRWHFYAGLYVIPFFMTLALSGLVMVYFNSVEARYGETRYVEVGAEMRSPVELIEAFKKTMPGAQVRQYRPPAAADRSAGLSVLDGSRALLVTLNPYNGKVLDVIEREATPYAIAHSVHGSLLIGEWGDRLIEIAAGLGILMLLTGFYLAWPGLKNIAAWCRPRWHLRGRLFWKDLHRSVGFYCGLVLCFFLISGLSWTGVWGGKLVQAWSSFPAEKSWQGVALADNTHASMNHGSAQEVPWGLEQSRMPVSGAAHGHSATVASRAINLNTVTELAREVGFIGQFRIDLPKDEQGVYTVSINTMQGDTSNPFIDRTLHIDQYSGKILAEVGYKDYSPMAKAMAVGIALHQGDMGWWNALLNTLFCLSVILLCSSGVLMWYLRRPKRAGSLVAPGLPADRKPWRAAIALMLLVSLAFPLTGLGLLFIVVLDSLLLQRVSSLKKVLQ